MLWEPDMGRAIIKPVSGEDFYFVFSSIVDAPILWGTRAEVEVAYSHATPERLDQADARGSDDSPGFFTWTTGAFEFRESIADRPERGIWLSVPRERVREFCETYSDDDEMFHPGDRFEWFLDDEDDEAPDDTAAEAADRVRIRAENFPGTVSDDAELRSHLTGIVGEEKVDEVIDALYDHRYERVRANIWINAFSLIRPSEETLSGIGKMVVDHVGVPGETVVRVRAN